MYLGNISKYFTINNVEKIWIKREYKFFFSVDLDIHERIVMKTFIVLLASIFNASKHTKCVSLNNQKSKTQPIITDLHPNEHSQELLFYPFTVKLSKCIESCYTT